jgi:signal transduction histidine kinase
MSNQNKSHLQALIDRNNYTSSRCFIWRLSKLVISIFLLFNCATSNAQLNLTDSAFYYFKKSINAQSVDTVTFEKGINCITRLDLSDALIQQFEQYAASISVDKKLYWRFLILNGVVLNLQKNDLNRCIAYGRKYISQAELIKEYGGIYIRSQFMKALRIPYRNSSNLKEGFKYFSEKLKEFKQQNDSIGIYDCYYVLAGFFRTNGLIDQGIYNNKKSRSYCDTTKDNSYNYGRFEKSNGKGGYATSIYVTGLYYLQKESYFESIPYCRLVIDQSKGSLFYEVFLSNAITNLAIAKMNLNQLDSVELFLKQAIKLSDSKEYHDFVVYQSQYLSDYYRRIGKYSLAHSILDACNQLIKKYKLPVAAAPGTIHPDYFKALVYLDERKLPDAIKMLQADLERLNGRNKIEIVRNYRLMATLYSKLGNHQGSSASYQKYVEIQDTLLSDQAQFQNISFETEEEMNNKERSIFKLAAANKIASTTRNYFIAFAVLLLFSAVLLYNRVRFKQRANKKLEDTLMKLTNTQTQLVQAEKMAFLGELTAGIAHEIQNPLNFVNNFAEVNTELIDELKKEIEPAGIISANELIEDIKANSEKITHHGKRADSIVKGMLQHSRKSSGQKELTDINALCDEYLRLSYHGLRAKDKSFNAEFDTQLDNTLPPISVVPQDIGRVILNLINNAFYAVNARQKMEQQGDYKPQVTISTRKEGNQLVIEVSDNGTGMTEQVKEKVFQPFFTTKPTGEGTGLGLSLSYDIVTKGHGGELRVETKEGMGTEFIIQLPIV